MLRYLKYSSNNKTFSLNAKYFKFFSTYYTKTHEYIKLEADTIYTVGITDFAASALGDVVYVDLPNIQTAFNQGDSFGSVESVKAASDVYSPLAGEVIAVNEKLKETPGTVNESPFEKGWFIKLKVTDQTGINNLMTETEYKKYLEEEKH